MKLFTFFRSGETDPVTIEVHLRQSAYKLQKMYNNHISPPVSINFVLSLPAYIAKVTMLCYEGRLKKVFRLKAVR